MSNPVVRKDIEVQDIQIFLRIEVCGLISFDFIQDIYIRKR